MATALRVRLQILPVLAALCGLGLASSQAPAAPVDLSPIFRAGDESTYSYKVESDMAMGVMGQAHQQAASNESDLTLKVASVTENEVKLVASFSKLKINIEGGPAPGSFDSTSPERPNSDDVYEQICRPMVDREFTVLATPDGEVLEVTGLNALRPDGMAGLLFDQLFGDDVIISMIQPMIRIKSDGEPVPVKGTWEETTTSVRSLNIMPAAVTLKLDSFANNQARISFTGSLISMPDEARDLPETKTEESVFKGECVWDTAAGRMKSLSSESSLKLLSEAQGISVTVDIDSRTSMKRIR